MTSPESFDIILNNTASQIYNGIVAAHERTPGQEVTWLGPYLQVEIEGDNPSERPFSPFLREVVVDYSPIPREADQTGIRPVLCFEYDEFGEFITLDHWVDDNDDNNEVHTIFRDEAGQYREDVVFSGEDDQYSTALILSELSPRLAGLFDREVIANYELQKQIFQTGQSLTPARIAQLLPMLKQAAADLSYLPS
ncbi:MAG: hypothetical protein ABI602_03080 [Candidatus Saccharibacteria bacterium]